MRADVFFDTNVLLYAIKLGDEKADLADELLASGGQISVQVLNEFVAVGRRKLKLDWLEIQRALNSIRELCGKPVPITIEVHELALQLARRYGFPFYDANIIAAARQAGCRTLYSEDMQHGQRIGDLQIVNPFL